MNENLKKLDQIAQLVSEIGHADCEGRRKDEFYVWLVAMNEQIERGRKLLGDT